MLYAVSVMYLGYTRCQGVQALNSDTKEFLEITPAVAKRLIDQGQLKGLLWRDGEEGIEFYCDTEGWNQVNIPVKTSCGKFRPLLNDYPGVVINSMYTVVRVIDTDYRGRLYEIVSNKCCRVKIAENNLRELAEITNVAGVWITDDGIKVAEGVKYEDRRAASKDQAAEAEIDVMMEEPNIDEIGDTELVEEEDGYEHQEEVVIESTEAAEPVKEKSTEEKPADAKKSNKNNKNNKKK